MQKKDSKVVIKVSVDEKRVIKVNNNTYISIKRLLNSFGDVRERLRG